MKSLEAAGVVLPLAEGTLQNVKNLGPAEALTGLVVRGDRAPLGRHLQALALLGRGAWPPAGLRAMKRLLEGK